MSLRRLALLGSTEGAWISLKGMRRPLLRVLGSQGQRIEVAVIETEGAEPTMLIFEGDGEYEVPEAVWARVGCVVRVPRIICDFVSNRRVA